METLINIPERQALTWLFEDLGRVAGFAPNLFTDAALDALEQHSETSEVAMLCYQGLTITRALESPDPKIGEDGYRSMARAALEQAHYLATGEVRQAHEIWREASLFEGADIISVYTRREAIEDGVLVDVSDTAREAGFTYPVALTRTLWEDCVAWNEADSRRQTHQDEAGRLWDVLTCARLAIGGAREGQTIVRGQVLRVPRGGRARRPRPTFFKVHCGPGDAGEPVITLMLPDED